MKKIKITEGFSLSNKLDIKFILGPCQIESASHAFEVCDEIDNNCDDVIDTDARDRLLQFVDKKQIF